MLNTAASLYIDGNWTQPVEPTFVDVVNPATETPCARVALGGAADIDRAVAAATRAFRSFSETDRPARVQMLRRLLKAYAERIGDLGDAMTMEMGAPCAFARHIQAGIGVAHLNTMIETLERFVFEQARGSARIVREPIGVAGLITPWNWPANQIVCKVAPALAAGCTVVLKPSELTPLIARIFAEIVAHADLPPGVFNLVQGNAEAGQALAAHPGVDVVSFTGSTRAGIAVAKAGADTVKRVTQELGGKSANLLLPDCEFGKAVSRGVRLCFNNSGQSCNAPTRMLVPEDRYAQVVELACRAAREMVVGDPLDSRPDLGPVAGAKQFERIQSAIGRGLAEGAELLEGGPGRPSGLEKGYYVRPTIFGRVAPNMTVAREEIFGPVLSILTYRDLTEAVDLANDSIYGLAAYVQGGDLREARAIARRLRVGSVYINEPPWSASTPFGGYKQSGNGREYAEFGLAEFLEIKSVEGYGKEDP